MAACPIYIFDISQQEHAAVGALLIGPAAWQNAIALQAVISLRPTLCTCCAAFSRPTYSILHALQFTIGASEG